MIIPDSSVVLEIQKRGEEKLNSKKAFKDGKLLGIVYGTGIKKNIPVIFSYNKFTKLLETTGEGALAKIKIEGEEKEKNVLVQDIQYDSYSGNLMHVDFLTVNLQEEVEVSVPLILDGIAPAVKNLGGTLVQNLESIEIKCKAKDIPKSIIVDISSLKTFDDIIYLKDIKLPEEIELNESPDVTVVMISAPRTEKEMEELEEVSADVSQVEGVEKEGEKEAAPGEKGTGENE